MEDQKIDIAEEAKKLLGKLEANVEMIARYQWNFYQKYLKVGFKEDQAIYLTGQLFRLNVK